MSKKIASILLVVAMEAEAAPIIERLGLSKNDDSMCVPAPKPHVQLHIHSHRPQHVLNIGIEFIRMHACSSFEYFAFLA
jgi:dihydroxyacetone kinase-like predicted kinase